MDLKDKKGKKTHRKKLKIIKKYWPRGVGVKVNNKIKITKKIIKFVQIRIQFKCKK